MPRCGNCKTDGQTVAHIRSCYAARYAARYTVPVPLEPARNVTNSDIKTLLAKVKATPFPGATALATPVETRWTEPMPPVTLAQLKVAVRPLIKHSFRGNRIGYFACVDKDTGVTKFYRVKVTKSNYVYVDIQASDDLHEVRNTRRVMDVLSEIVDDAEGCARRYAKELGRCYRCGRTLTDETSRARGIGPDCATKVS